MGQEDLMESFTVIIMVLVLAEVFRGTISDGIAKVISAWKKK